MCDHKSAELQEEASPVTSPTSISDHPIVNASIATAPRSCKKRPIDGNLDEASHSHLGAKRVMEASSAARGQAVLWLRCHLALQTKTFMVPESKDSTGGAGGEGHYTRGAKIFVPSVKV
jgi:hypothetical protein